MNKMLNSIKKNAGLVMVATGIGVTTVGVICAKKSGIKAKELMREHAENVKVIEECANTLPEEQYSEQDKINDTNINNVQTTLKIIKVCSIPVMITLVGIGITIKGIRKTYLMKQLQDNIQY